MKELLAVKLYGTPDKKNIPQQNVLLNCSLSSLRTTILFLMTKNYIQVRGTSMGTKMAPSYANIFMGNLEKQLLSGAPYKPLSWFRFIDDIDIKWNESQEHLIDFFNYCNNFHPTIKFTFEFSGHKISFLDTTTSIQNGMMTTDLHTKATDKHQFLSPKSCHPRHCSRSIPYSQAIRIKRICSTENTQNHRLNELRKHLLKRGYKNKNIAEAFGKADNVSRDSLLNYKDKNITNSRIPLVVTYHPDLKNISNVLRKHWNLIENDPILKKLFPEPPIMAYRRPNSLKDIIVNARVKMNSPSKPGGYNPCNRSNCKCCKAANVASTFRSTTTNESFTIYSNCSCKSSNCIYILTCGICNIQYVGETETAFNMRLNNHRSFFTKNRNCPLTRHLKTTGHSFDTVKFQIIDQNPKWNTSTRRLRETFWIHQLKTLEPDGLNERNPQVEY